MRSLESQIEELVKMGASRKVAESFVSTYKKEVSPIKKHKYQKVISVQDQLAELMETVTTAIVIAPEVFDDFLMCSKKYLSEEHPDNIQTKLGYEYILRTVYRRNLLKMKRYKLQNHALYILERIRFNPSESGKYYLQANYIEDFTEALARTLPENYIGNIVDNSCEELMTKIKATDGLDEQSSNKISSLLGMYKNKLETNSRYHDINWRKTSKPIETVYLKFSDDNTKAISIEDLSVLDIHNKEFTKKAKAIITKGAYQSMYVSLKSIQNSDFDIETLTAEVDEQTASRGRKVSFNIDVRNIKNKVEKRNTLGKELGRLQAKKEKTELQREAMKIIDPQLSEYQIILKRWKVTKSALPVFFNLRENIVKTSDIEPTETILSAIVQVNDVQEDWLFSESGELLYKGSKK